MTGRPGPSDAWVLSALAAGIFLAHACVAGWGVLYNETDGQYAAAAKHMAQGGSWLVPENNGAPRLVKPPLLYWSIAAGFGVFGVGEFAARLPNAVAFAGWACAVFLIARRFLSLPAAVFASGMIGLCLGAFTLGRIVMPEPLFACFFAWALYCVIRGYGSADHRKLWYSGFWLACALACFVKGWHGILLPLAIVLAAAVAARTEWHRLRPLTCLSGPAILLAINLPWLLYIEFRYPGFLRQFVMDEGLGHVFGNDVPATARVDVPPAQFLLLHLVWWFPATVVGIAGLIRWLYSGVGKSARPDFTVALVWAWAVVTFLILLLLGQRQDYYAMTAWPAVFIGIAWLWERHAGAMRYYVLGCVYAVGIPLGLAAAAVGATDTSTAPMEERASAWTTVTNFDPIVWQSLGLLIVVVCAAAAIFTFAAAVLEQLRRRIAAVVFFLAAAFATGIGAVAGVDAVSPYFSHAAIARSLHAMANRTAPVVFDGPVDTGSSLLFYLDEPVFFVDRDAEYPSGESQNDMKRTRILGIEAVAAMRDETGIALITETVRRGEWEERFGPLPAPAASSGTQVLLMLESDRGNR